MPDTLCYECSLYSGTDKAPPPHDHPDTLTLIRELREAAERALDAEPLGPLPVDPSMSVDPRTVLTALAHIDAITAAVQALDVLPNEDGDESDWISRTDVLAILRGES